MKKLLPLILFIAGCNAYSDPKHLPTHVDTTYPVVIYRVNGDMQYGVWRRVMVDSFAFVNKDSNTRVREWTRVPIYYVPLLDSASKKMLYYQVGPGVVIADMNVNTDSLSKLYPNK